MIHFEVENYLLVYSFGQNTFFMSFGLAVLLPVIIKWKV